MGDGYSAPSECGRLLYDLGIAHATPTQTALVLAALERARRDGMAKAASAVAVCARLEQLTPGRNAGNQLAILAEMLRSDVEGKEVPRD